jgi:hypothetical protein
MEKGKKEVIQVIVAKVISVLFHPLFMPLYGLIIIFSAPTLFWYLPFKVKKTLLIIILVNNVVIPVSLLPFFRYRNIISSFVMEERNERVVPLLIISLLYSVTSFVMFRLQIPLFLKTYFYSISFVAVLVLLITLWYKVSIHSVSAGAMIGTILALSLKMSISLNWFLIPAIIIGGIILSARLKLNSHNSLQVYFGFMTGLAGISLFMLFFQ